MEDDFQFEWGKKGGVGKNGVQFYQSFTLNGVQYSLYDYVYIYCTGCTETDIATLVEIYDTEGHEKKIKVVWFFRPGEISNYLGAYEPRWNEIFLASGEGTGFSNINYLETIVGKCNVVCTANDPKNLQPSEEEYKKAHYIFKRTFDVGKREILKKFPDEISGIKVECFFNKRNNSKLIIRNPTFPKNLKNPAGQSNLSSKLELDKVMTSPVKNVLEKANVSSKLELDKVTASTVKNVPEKENVSSKLELDKVMASPVKNVSEKANVSSKLELDKVMASQLKNVSEKAMVHIGDKRCVSNETLRTKTALKGNGTQSARISCCQDTEKRKVKFINLPPMSASDTRPYKKMRVADAVASTKGESSGKKPNVDRSNWFKQLPWEERLQKAQDAGTLVLLDNLDPSYASSEVVDLVWLAFQEKVEAKMIQKTTFSHPQYGKAFVIFKSKIAADSAIYKLKMRCLMQANGRPVFGTRRTLKMPDKAAKFVGHLSIDKMRLQNQREEMRKAVSTAHCSQPNNIEYNMAMDWRLLQEKSDAWWKALHEEQAKEIREVRRELVRGGL